jgi:hypothetical protein
MIIIGISESIDYQLILLMLELQVMIMMRALKTRTAKRCHQCLNRSDDDNEDFLKQ